MYFPPSTEPGRSTSPASPVENRSSPHREQISPGAKSIKHVWQKSKGISERPARPIARYQVRGMHERWRDRLCQSIPTGALSGSLRGSAAPNRLPNRSRSRIRHPATGAFPAAYRGSAASKARASSGVPCRPTQPGGAVSNHNDEKRFPSNRKATRCPSLYTSREKSDL